MSWLRAFLVWLLIIAIESVHGTLRVLFLQPLVGDFRARQIAVFTGSLPLIEPPNVRFVEICTTAVGRVATVADRP